MAKNVDHIQHIKSNVVLENNGLKRPKLPNPSDLTEGEIAINYAKGYETISFKNSSGEVITFSSDNQNSEKFVNKTDAEKFFDNAKYELSGTTHVINFYNGETIKATIDATDFIKDGMIDTVSVITSASTTVLVITWNTDAGKSQTILDIGDIFEADNYYTKTNIDSKLGSAFTGSNSGVTITKYIENNELVVSNALNDLSANKLDASAYTPTDLSNYYTKSETSGKTEIASALSGKVNSSDVVTAITPSNSASTAPVSVSVVAENELLAANALNYLSANKLDASAYTPTDLSNYYTKSETSGKTEIATALTDKLDTSAFDTKLGSAFTGSNSGVTITKYIEDNELVLATALNDLSTNKLDASAYTPTDLSNYYTKSETSGKTEIATALSGKVNSSDVVTAITPSNSASTAPVSVSVVAENELLAANALNYLSTNKLDASAYTPTDLSNYYTKSETSGKTEIETALTNKLDTSAFDTKLGSAFTGSNSGVTITKYIEDNELVAASAIADLSTNKLDVSAYTPTIEASGVTAMTSYQIAASSASVLTTDTLLQAIGKLEKRILLLETALGGMTLQKVTTYEYNSLTTKDPNTIYIIND